MARLEYELGADPEALIGRIGELGRLEPRGTEQVERTWYDTFDWRLYRRGQVLEADRSGHSHEARWRRLSDGGLEAVFTSEVPRFARDLRPGPLRERLCATIDVRALLPVSTVRCEQVRYVLENREHKTVARICAETSQPRGNAPVRRLLIETVAGYVEPVERVRVLLEDELGVPRAARDMFYVAVEATGRQPGDYTSRLTVDLDAAMTAGAAARRILGLLLEKVVLNLDGVRDDVDIEFLHDLRTAVRRARSALRQFRQVLHPGLQQRLARELRWVGQISSPTRDLDVQRFELNEVWPDFEPDLYAALEPIGDLIERKRSGARRQMLTDFESTRFPAALDLWRSLLNQGDPPRAAAPRVEEPICWLAARRIRKLHGRVRADGAALDATAPAEQFHDLRKLGKQFRYTIEMFQSLYPRELVKPALRGLKDLQDVLGRFNDLSVQQETFHAWAGELAGQAGSGETLLALGRLVERLRSEQGEVRAVFHDRFEQFDRPELRRQIRRLGRKTGRA